MTLTAGAGLLVLRGVLGTDAAALLWPRLLDAAAKARGASLVIDVAGLTGVKTAGAALLAAAVARHGDATLRGAPAALTDLVAQFAAAQKLPAVRPAAWTYTGLVRTAFQRGSDAVTFLGESIVAAVSLPRRRRQLRIGDFFRLADQAGGQALPLVLLLGYLMGLILAFQSSIPLRRFGADLFVVNLVALSLLRELGPLLSAVVLAGRTGSAFAAELGSMKVNEEIAALQTMGVSPMTMLVLPRLAAAALVMPVLTLFLDLAGLCGMVTVMIAFGFAPAAIGTQLLRAVHGGDLWGGLFKAFCFGAVVAALGCRSGLAAGDGPRAVGQAATAAVVGGIVATIVLDGIFSVVFYRLGV